MNRTRRSVRVVPGMLVALAVTACSAVPEDSGIDPAAADTVLAEIDLAPVESFDEDPVAQLPGEGEPRDFNLLLVNRLGADAYVYASAGAARVALDTVPRSDSVFVDIRLRSDQVRLEAEDGSGTVISSIEFDLVRSQLNRWEMTALRSDRVALRANVDPLVTSADGDYPRN